MELDELVIKFKPKFIKVKGHSDNEYNNRCDELARMAIDKEWQYYTNITSKLHFRNIVELALYLDYNNIN